MTYIGTSAKRSKQHRYAALGIVAVTLISATAIEWAINGDVWRSAITRGSLWVFAYNHHLTWLQHLLLKLM